MNQEYINSLSENYDPKQVPHFYLSSDGTAFGNLHDARRHAARQKDKAIKQVPHGGKLSDAVNVDDEVTTDVNIEAVATPNAGGAADDIDIAKLKREQLVEICQQRGIEAPEKATKAQLLALLNTPPSETETKEKTIDDTDAD